jgi:hypothetical protein
MLTLLVGRILFCILTKFQDACFSGTLRRRHNDANVPMLSFTVVHMLSALAKTHYETSSRHNFSWYLIVSSVDLCSTQG